MNAAMTINGKSETRFVFNDNLKTAMTKTAQCGLFKEVQQSSLTFLILQFMLYPLSQKTKVGIETPRKGEKSPLPIAVFFCPVISNTGLIRVKFIMVDCFRESLIGFARSFAGSLNLIQSTAMLLRPTGGGKFTSQRNTAMSQNNSVLNAQAPIVLNPQTLANVMQVLERAQNHAGNLSLQYDNHRIAPDLTRLECEIAQAYDLLSRVIMSGVKSKPAAKNSPEEKNTTLPKRQTTGYGLEVDGAGYDCRVLLDDDGDYVMVTQHCSPPYGHRQVCIKCGYDRFNEGVHYVKCPECEAAVNYHCRYVSIAGGK